MSSRWFSSLSSLALSLAIAGLCGSARAQETDASYYDGTWTARLSCPAGSGDCAGQMVLADFAGTWQDLSGRSADKRLCGGKKMPITVQRSTRSVLAFTAFGDGASATCPTLSVRVKPVDDKALEGTFLAGPHAMESAEVHASHAGPAGASAAGRDAASAAAAAKSIRLEKR